jgi:hypothetical protein
MLFDRVYKLQVGKAGGEGVEITDLKITFDIQKTTKKNPNTGTIKVWNLTEKTRKQLEQPDTKCILYAGYKDDAGALLIFSGGVTHAWSKIDGADIVTEFELGDGTQEMRDTTISVGYAQKVKSKTVLNDVSQKMGLPLTLPGNAPEREWQHGLSYHGPATGLLDKVTKGTGLEWSVQNGSLQVLEQGMVTTRQGIELAVDSGLIYSPERIRKSKTGTKQKDANASGAPVAAQKTQVPKSKPLGGITIPGFTPFEVETTATEAPITVTPSTGAITAKKKGKGKGGKGKVTDQYDGWNIKTLLMPTINPGDRIKLTSRFVEGVFRVHEIKHTGDSHGGNWMSEMKVVDPAAPLGDAKSTSKAKGGKKKKGKASETSALNNRINFPGSA